MIPPSRCGLSGSHESPTARPALRSHRHSLLECVLSYWGWRYAEVAASETFLALQQGLQHVLWTLGGVPEVVRIDNTSAATHELRSSRGRALNDNYAALLDHYGLCSTRINPGQNRENGVAEHAHYRLKDAINQALVLQGSRDFDTADDYAGFVRQMVERRNRLVEGKLEQETLCLGSLPPAPVPEWRGERTDLEYVRIRHLAATTMEATVDSALSSVMDADKCFDYAAVRNLAERKPPEIPLLDPVRLARPQSLRPPAPGQPGGGGAVRMTIADTSVMQERICHLCHHFKLSTVAAEKVARFTAAGHGDALPTFIKVL